MKEHKKFILFRWYCRAVSTKKSTGTRTKHLNYDFVVFFGFINIRYDIYII